MAPAPGPYGPLASHTVTIANGESVSGGVDLNGAGLLRIIMPASWTAASLTFQVSADGVTWNDLYDSAGEYTIATAAASRAIVLPPSDFAAMRYIRVRSGTAAAAVSQGGARSIELVGRVL